MWKKYSELNKYKYDFIVKYRFYSLEEGGRKTLPRQGYRCDFLYENEDPQKDGIYAIYPEFLDEKNKIIEDTSKSVDNIGKALMWIMNPELRHTVHVDKIKVGTKGYFVEGAHKIAEVEVVSIDYIIENLQIK